MLKTTFKLLDRLQLPAGDINERSIALSEIFSAEEVEKYYLKSLTQVAIMSDLDDMPGLAVSDKHLYIIVASITKSEYNVDLYNIYKAITENVRSNCLVIFECNGNMKLAAGEVFSYSNGQVYLNKIFVSKWVYEDYFDDNVEAYGDIYEIKCILNSKQSVCSIYGDLLNYLKIVMVPEFMTVEQVKAFVRSHCGKVFSKKLAEEYVLETANSTYRNPTAPVLRYEKSSVIHSCCIFAAA